MTATALTAERDQLLGMATVAAYPQEAILEASPEQKRSGKVFFRYTEHLISR